MACVIVILALVTLTFITETAVANPYSRWDSLYAYMGENYDSAVEGGYSVPDSEASRLYPTYGGATALNERGMMAYRPPVVDLVKMKNFTRKLQWRSGGEEYDRYGGFSLFIAGSVSMENSYYGVKLWQLLDEHNDVPGMTGIEILNATAAMIFLNKTQSSSGGFGTFENTAPDIVSTFQALYIMDYMTQISDEIMSDWLWNETATIEWILSCRDGSAFKLSPSSEIRSISATAAALMALDVLGELDARIPVADQQDMRNWILDLQDTGFQESILTNDTNLISTYHAFEALEILGGMPAVDGDAASRFILDCQAADGSWGIVPGLETGTLFNAGLALEALRMLDPSGTYSNMILEEDPNNPAPPIFDWRLLLVAVIFIVAIAVAFLALRMD